MTLFIAIDPCIHWNIAEYDVRTGHRAVAGNQQSVINNRCSVKYQQPTLRLLPAGATVAGWDIFPPTGSARPYTPHEKSGLAGRKDVLLARFKNSAHMCAIFWVFHNPFCYRGLDSLHSHTPRFPKSLFFAKFVERNSGTTTEKVGRCSAQTYGFAGNFGNNSGGDPLRSRLKCR